jgi:DNA-binding NarL/FixJ family response regulator
MNESTTPPEQVAVRRRVEGWMFLSEAARDLRTVGAVAPSSRALARVLTAAVRSQAYRPLSVLEAGAGTGAVTRALVAELMGDYQRRYRSGCETVWANVPPARVWRLQRPAQPSPASTAARRRRSLAPDRDSAQSRNRAEQGVPMIRVLIADDDALVRMGLADLLHSDDSIDVVAQAHDGRHAVELATTHHVDVALLDVRMPRMDGITATAHLQALPDPPKVIALTTFDLDEYVYNSLAAGADGFLLKDTDPAEILRAVHVVAAGSAMLHPSATRRLIDRYHHSHKPQTAAARARIDRLTPRERDVLTLLAQGDTNADIAGRLHMRESTVKAHVSRILTALEVNNRVQAALLARDAGLP